MRSPDRRLASILIGACALLALYPALAQQKPQSILPPGFGEPDTPPPAEESGSASNTVVSPPPAPETPQTSAADGTLRQNDPDNAAGNMVAAAPMEDLPPQARRSLDQVGLLATLDGGLGSDAFGNADGRYLATLMNGTRAPIASRWLSILLRRALLSQATAPANIEPADWVGHRAWLLVRMGEADNARALVQRVDTENYTPWLYEIAMQSALATADPAALCGLADRASVESDKAAWTLARAMCAGIAGEGGTASSLVGQARNAYRASGIDVLLAEKIVGAGTNTRRAVNIQWDGVDRLTAWRFGLASASGVAIPERLFATSGPQVRAWAARAPLFEPGTRADFADRAATLGVFSSAALVDIYGSIYDATDPGERGGTPAETLRTAFTGAPAARLSAFTTLTSPSGNAVRDYARSILAARAAAGIPRDATDDGRTIDALIGSMMTAGLDVQAARWAAKTEVGSLGWALLAVGAPRPLSSVDRASVEGFDLATARGRMLVAGLAGLGRLSRADVDALSSSSAFDLNARSAWTLALDAAAARGEKGTVALLCAVGMQTGSWAGVPAAHLYRIVDALRRVGLEPEARMIAAEAVART